MRAAWLALALATPAAALEPPAHAPVVLLHGLARSAASMEPMAQALAAAGHATCRIDYPSRRHGLADLARQHVAPALARCGLAAGEPVLFVTHSMGGLVLRQLALQENAPRIGRVVMLGPPNQGSEIVDRLGHWPMFRWLNGPAGTELGTAPTATPRRLGPARFEVGIIAGTRSINPLLSTLIPGPDDGKLSPQRAQLDGMRDFVVLPVAHPLMMRDPEVQRQTLRFLESGHFDHARAG